MKKRIIPSILAVVMLLSIAAVPTFASTAPANNAGATTVTGAYEAITIAVDVPGSVTAAINPYGMPIDLKDTDNTTVLATVSGQQVTTRPIYVVNKTTVPLYVGATVVTTTKGSLAMVKDATAISTAKNKSAFLYLQMAATELGEDAMNTELNTNKDGYKGYALKNSAFYPVFAAWDQDFDADKDLVLATGDAGVKGDKMILLAAAEKVAESGTSGQDGFVPEHNAVAEGGIGMVRISGVVVEEPSEKWAVADGFTARITYIFKPDTTAAKITTDNAAIDLSDPGTSDIANLEVNLTGGSAIESVDWKLVNAAGEEIDAPVGVTLDPDGGDEDNQATLKVESGALKGPQNVIVKAIVTREDGLVFEGTKTIKVTGDVEIKQSYGATTDCEDGTGNTLTIDNTAGAVEYYLKVELDGDDISAITWSIEDEDNMGNTVAAEGTDTDGVAKFTCAADDSGDDSTGDGTFTVKVEITGDNSGLTYTVYFTVTVENTKAQ